MLIQVNTDDSIRGGEALARRVEAEVRSALGRFSKRITRVNVHLSDENGDPKSGPADKRCVLEARLGGLKPIAVSHRAAVLDQAVGGALGKLTRAIDNTLGRLSDR
jgi:hypothetical protein